MSDYCDIVARGQIKTQVGAASCMTCNSASLRKELLSELVIYMMFYHSDIHDVFSELVMYMMFFHKVIYMTFCHRYLNTSWRSENIGHTLEEEANQRGQRSSGHRPALKDYWVIIGVNQRKERNSHQVGKVVQLVLAPLVLSTQSRRGDHMICRRDRI